MLSRGVRLLWIKESDEAAFQQSAMTTPSSISQIAHCALDACLSAENISWQEAASKAGLEIICRWINRPDSELTPTWHELSQIARAHEFSTHSSRVATYAVLFAMAFEHEDPQFLADLAIAGFLHDLGKLHLGIPLASSLSQKISEDQTELWNSHPEASVQLIERLGAQVSERSRLWILQHHERFGGGGYPLGLEGYKVEDISQLLAAADLLDELSSGRWDEKRRGLRGAFEALESFDRQQTFPQFFNPDLFKALLGWSSRTKSAAKSAAA
jgi:HD-GYP domain-containing protein (c-di-GMP phosphodiesterase class II)